MPDNHWFSAEADIISFLEQQPINTPLLTEVRIVRCLFRNEENGYSVYDVEDTNHRWFKILGYFPTQMKIDGYYTVDGVVKSGKYGRVLQVMDYRSALPHDEAGIITVLRTLPRLDTAAPTIYHTLGGKALEIILNDPEQVVSKCKGVGIATARAWQAVLRSIKESDVILRTLQNYKIPIAAAKALLGKYPDILERLKRSPYFLVDEVRGFSFPKCDTIALENDYPLDGQERLEQAALYVLEQDSYAYGNCFMEQSAFEEAYRKLVDVTVSYREARDLLIKEECSIDVGSQKIIIDRDDLCQALEAYHSHPGHSTRFSYTCYRIPDEDIAKAMKSLQATNRMVIEQGHIYSGLMHHAEVTVAKTVQSMVSGEYGFFQNVEQVLNKICEKENIQLEEKQREAVLKFCQARGGLFILNGRAGCGKTFTLNIIIKVLKELYRQQDLYFSAKIMAPTGKAAQVAHGATGLPATTVHRALNLVAGQGLETDAVIQGECVVIDEFSMMGIQLSAALLKSISPGTKVIIMGDFEQLPSIDAGNVLQDLIASGVVPVVTLNVVKRQKEGSGILYNANQILDGQMIRSAVVNENGATNNAYIFRTDDTQKCRDEILKKVAMMHQRGYSVDDIQVLCPQRKTDIGVDAMNYVLQSILNPSKGDLEVINKTLEIRNADGEVELVQMKFRTGDKVIHTKNDYDMKFYQYKQGEGFVEDFSRQGIINGETGRIARIMTVKNGDSVHQRIYVQYGNNQFALYEDNWDDLSMAYAMSIHRAQGSQWPIVMAPIMMTNRSMLNRKLFYTLYTRAQSVSMTFGTADAIQYAIENVASTRRNTWLKERLRVS